MKKYIMYVLCFCFFVLSCKADIFSINYDYDKQQVEIYQHDLKEPILILPFYEYSRAILNGNNLYVLKYETPRIRNFGYIYKFNLITGEIINTKIMSGKDFDIDSSGEYICISSDIPYEEESDIINIFDLPPFVRRYPLGVQIMELKTGKLLKEFHLIPKLTEKDVKSLLLSILFLQEKNVFYISYGYESSTKKRIEGYINLETLEFNPDMER